MRIKILNNDLSLQYSTKLLLHQILSPLCGLLRSIGFMRRSRMESHIITAGAELTGVHILRNLSKPKQGAYHIGGSGIFLEESIIRVLGETVERYSQVTYETFNRDKIIFANYAKMKSDKERILTAEKCVFFSAKQYANSGFPFTRFSTKMPMGWLKVMAVYEEHEVWVPAQFFIVGYTIKDTKGEKWIMPAVTTGTASHTEPALAFRNALLELIQIDAAMGHWYSSSIAPRIELDERVNSIEKLIESHFNPSRRKPEFYFLNNPDLYGITVACIIREEPGNIPAVAIGLGIDLTLEHAMYKALLEAAGVVQLAKITRWYDSIGSNAEQENENGITQIYDLDRNVAFYSFPENISFIDSKFDQNKIVLASDLPLDVILGTKDELRFLIKAFKDTDKELVYLDITPRDVRGLGFTTIRIWSPDTLSLSLPSAPCVKHPRYSAYGGVHHEYLHPYP